MAKTKAFFLHAATEAGFELGRHLKASSGSSGASSRRPKAKRKKAPKEGADGTPQRENPPAGDYPLLIKGLLEQLPKGENKWSPAEFESWRPMWEGALRNLYVDESKK